MTDLDCKHCHGPHDVQQHATQKAAHEAGQKCSLCEQVSHEKHLGTIPQKRSRPW
jgi:hypothetical protein